MLDVSLVRAARRRADGGGGVRERRVHRATASRNCSEQLGGWAADGFRAVKMKVGTHPARTWSGCARHARRSATTSSCSSTRTAPTTRKQALRFAEQFADLGVTWFEEPVSSDDLDGLRLLRDRAPGGMRIAAGEYGYTPAYFHAMLAAGAVDVLQADATRCGGPTGFLLAAAQARWHRRAVQRAHRPGHPRLARRCAARRAINVEYFHDHALIEGLFFDGAVPVSGGMLRPDRGAPGLGLAFRRADAEPYLHARVSLPG